MYIPVIDKILIAFPVIEVVDGVEQVVGISCIPVIAFEIPRHDPLPITVHGTLKFMPNERFYKFNNQLFFFNPDYGYMKDEDVLSMMKDQYKSKKEKATV